MKDWSIRRRILVSFGFILVLVVGMGGIAYTRLARIDREATAVAADSIEGLADGLGIQDAWSNDFLLTEEHALQADPATRQALETRLRAGQGELDKLLAAYETTAITPDERQSLEAFARARQAYTQIQNQILNHDA